MKTRHTFNVEGIVVCGENRKLLFFKVRSNTKINRIINILCAIADKQVSEVKDIRIWCNTKTHSEWYFRHHIYAITNNCDQTFRSLCIVGKKNIKFVLEV